LKKEARIQILTVAGFGYTDEATASGLVMRSSR